MINPTKQKSKKFSAKDLLQEDKNIMLLMEDIVATCDGKDMRIVQKALSNVMDLIY